MAKQIVCKNKRCRSTNLVPVDTQKKFSFTKAIVGNTIGGLINPAGAIIGTAAGLKGKKGKTTFFCQDCGQTFEIKL